jgi:hypothetical protein
MGTRPPIRSRSVGRFKWLDEVSSSPRHNLEKARLNPPQGLPWGERFGRGTLWVRMLPGQFPLDNPAAWRDNRRKPPWSPQAMRNLSPWRTLMTVHGMHESREMLGETVKVR